VDNNFGKQGQDLADKTADKVQSGIRSAQEVANRGADKLSEGIDSVRRNTGPTLAETADKAQSVANQAMESLNNASQKVRATVADIGDSVLARWSAEIAATACGRSHGGQPREKGALIGYLRLEARSRSGQAGVEVSGGVALTSAARGGLAWLSRGVRLVGHRDEEWLQRGLTSSR
jgi:ElaB/YqjD/DUF883 family membrane-anchored ribosome-binding protein